MNSEIIVPTVEPSPLRSLQALGILCGFAAGAWLGAAEAPTKLVTIGISPLVISLIHGRRRIPRALECPRGTSHIRADVRHVVGGSILMALGAGAIALSSTTKKEHGRWHEAAERESRRYGIEVQYVQAGLEGRQGVEGRHRRTWFDLLLVIIVTGIFVIFAALVRAPQVTLNWNAVAGLVLLMLLLLLVSGVALWRITRFN